MGKLLAYEERAQGACAFKPLGASCRTFAVDNGEPQALLIRGAKELGIEVDARAAGALAAYARELLRWNARVNLVGRAAQWVDVLEKHLLDSIAVAPELANASTLLDIGSGAGMPGIPLRLVRPMLDVTLVESIGKKVAFMRQVIAQLKLGSHIRVQQVRAEGFPESEHLPRADAVISRALAPLPRWLELGFAYAGPNGRVLGMLATASDAALRSAAKDTRARLLSVRRYALPLSGAPRTVAVFSHAL